MAGKVYFITGANRGIGFELAKKLWSPENTIIASSRNPDNSPALQEFAKEHSNVFIVKLDVASQESLDQLDAQLANVAPEGIDVFVSNAGFAKIEAYVPIVNSERSVFLDHYTTNTLGAVLATKVVYPHLLKKDTRQIFFTSSVAGQLTQFFPMSSSAYGQSKAALNHSVISLAYELKEEGFTVVPYHPGLVLTDLAHNLLEDITRRQPDLIEQIKGLTITPEECADHVAKLFAKITKDDNGKFYNYDGTAIPY